VHNTQILKGIRCPECFSESTSVVQMTMNVVMQDDGAVFFSCSQPGNDHFPGHVIPDDTGFRYDDPIECFQRSGNCGHRGTVKEFREAKSFIADARSRRFVVPGIHLSDKKLTDEVNRLVREARAAGEPTWFDREITVDQAAGIRTWSIVTTDDEGNETIDWNTGENWDRVTESTPGAQPVTIYEE
jgi:hypothetical protein